MHPVIGADDLARMYSIAKNYARNVMKRVALAVRNLAATI
jgi:hypothetical protein